MKGLMNIYYDEEGDFLEITLGKSKEGYAEEIDEGVFIRKDEETNEVLGIGILNFKKKSHNLKNISLSLPININFNVLRDI